MGYFSKYKVFKLYSIESFLVLSDSTVQWVCDGLQYLKCKKCSFASIISLPGLSLHRSVITANRYKSKLSHGNEC